MKDLYATLGVAKTATPEEIKRAYRKLASQHHPDKGGDTARFQEIEEAYRVLSDPQQRAHYDQPRPQMNNFQFNMGPGGFDFDSIFNMFGARMHPGHQRPPAQARMNLWVQLADVATGGKRTVSVGSAQGQQVVEIEIPPGVEDGETFNYPGLAPGGVDLVVTYRIHPNPRWQRQGLNLYTDSPVSVWTLILGGEVEIRDLLGRELTVGIPKSCQPGTMLRCRGRGLSGRRGESGDLMIRVQAQIPTEISPELMAQIQAETHR